MNIPNFINLAIFNIIKPLFIIVWKFLGGGDKKIIKGYQPDNKPDNSDEEENYDYYFSDSESNDDESTLYEDNKIINNSEILSENMNNKKYNIFYNNGLFKIFNIDFNEIYKTTIPNINNIINYQKGYLAISNYNNKSILCVLNGKAEIIKMKDIQYTIIKCKGEYIIFFLSKNNCSVLTLLDSNLNLQNTISIDNDSNTDFVFDCELIYERDLLKLYIYIVLSKNNIYYMQKIDLFTIKIILYEKIYINNCLLTFINTQIISLSVQKFRIVLNTKNKKYPFKDYYKINFFDKSLKYVNIDLKFTNDYFIDYIEYTNKLYLLHKIDNPNIKITSVSDNNNIKDIEISNIKIKLNNVNFVNFDDNGKLYLYFDGYCICIDIESGIYEEYKNKIFNDKALFYKLDYMIS